MSRDLLDLYKAFQEDFDITQKRGNTEKKKDGKSDTSKAKIKKKSIPKVVKDLTWAKWVGDDIAKTKCLCCGVNEIKMNSFHCGHVISEADGGTTTVDNMRPICVTCNLSMGTENMDSFRVKYGFANSHMNPNASLRLTNNKVVASASLGSASVSMSVPVNQVVQAISNVMLPMFQQPTSLISRNEHMSRIEILVAEGKLFPCPGQQERYELGGLFPTSPCKSDSSRFRRHCSSCGYHYHYVAGYTDGLCPCTAKY